jgi:hypothetical protein
MDLKILKNKIACFFNIRKKTWFEKKNSKITQFIYVAIEKHDIQACRYL